MPGREDCFQLFIQYIIQVLAYSIRKLSTTLFGSVLHFTKTKSVWCTQTFLRVSVNNACELRASEKRVRLITSRAIDGEICT